MTGPGGIDARPAVVVSALRCIATYVVVPALVPLVGVARWVATPIVVVLLATGIVLSTTAFVRARRRGSARTLLLTSALLSLNLLALANLLG